LDIEYHFYITYIIALRAGFDIDSAYKIAYSSQYTDDNNTIYHINEGKADAYQNYISQTMNILKPKEELIRIHPVFHFFPGTANEILKCSTPRRDGKFHLLNTTPGNKNAQKLLKAALRSNNLCRIGIATHTFVDTYSHQNFVGMKDEFNAMKGFLEHLIPNIGHADAKHNPDRPALKWEDDKLSSGNKKIDNKARFLMASEHIFEMYRLYLKPKHPKKKLENEKVILKEELSKAIGGYDKKNEKKKNRISRYKKLIGDSIKDYDKKAWFKIAIQRKREEVIDNITDMRSHEWFFYWKYNYKKSDWYIFQEAVKANQKKGMEILKPLFDQIEVVKLGIW
jgi:hypothetical protein